MAVGDLSGQEIQKMLSPDGAQGLEILEFANRVEFVCITYIWVYMLH